MNNQSLTRTIRRTHMYSALFLTPWILLYALSSLVFNHLPTVRGWYGGDLGRFEQIDQLEYKASFSNETSPADAARQILRDLDMDGSHFVQGSPVGERLTINRQAGAAVRRITYLPKEGRITIERQIYNTPGFLMRLHMRHGYEQPYVAAKAWGLGVEVTVLAMMFWIVSGIWMWWEIKPARMWGAVFALGGLGLFALLLFAI
jgi:hypothetical protein